MKTKISSPLLTLLALVLLDLVPAFGQTSALRANGKIAFTSDRDGNHEIYVMNADGTNQVRLTNNLVVDDHPTWSPDGTKIAFVSEKTPGVFAIFVMNADGTNKIEITPLIFNATAYPIWDAWGMSWSPDGNRIVFQEKVEPSPYPAYPNDIFIVNVDGSNRHRLLVDPADDRQPSWSPDGSKILFSRSVSDFYHNLFTVRPDGTDLQPLASNPGDTDLAAAWSPGGDKIAFQLFDYANFENIAIVNADGSNRHWFDNGSVDPWGGRDKPNWSPDGNKIVFHVSLGASGAWDIEIFVKSVDGTGLTQITDTPGNNFKPSWQSLAPAACPNPIDCPDLFVRQHYRDFLGREADTPGLAHWTNEITMCSDVANRLAGETEAQCIDRKRANTSGAFYISNEFQNSANFLIRVNWGSLGQDRAIGRKCIAAQHSALDAVCRPLYTDYISDLAKLTQGIVVNDALDPNAINLNKHNFVNEFVTRADFLAAYPNTMAAAEYVDKLSQTTGIALTAQERADLIAKVGTDGRAAVLYDLVDGTTTIDGGLLRFDTRYGKAYYDQEFNPAFVFVEYLAYLRRNPDQAGFDHWLGKLNLYGNFVDAEMVRAFIVSDEYRKRFGLQ